jgi:hypothetical protein
LCREALERATDQQGHRGERDQGVTRGEPQDKGRACVARRQVGVGKEPEKEHHEQRQGALCTGERARPQEDQQQHRWR